MGLDEKMKFFAKMGGDYCDAYLSRYDWARMERGREYALKAFLYAWAYERNGAARGWRIAAVKAIVADKGSGDMEDIFNKYYEPKDGTNNNKKLNPCMDNKIREINIPKGVCEQIKKGDFSGAFAHMGKVNGLKSHKLRAFFLRDLTVKLGKEPVELKNLLFLQPIDIWLKETIESLWPGESKSDERLPNGYGSEYGFNGEVYRRAKWLINASKEAGVSSLKVNQGIWYFCANFVANVNRLKDLLKAGTEAMEQEVELLGDFNPKSSASG